MTVILLVYIFIYTDACFWIYFIFGINIYFFLIIFIRLSYLALLCINLVASTTVSTPEHLIVLVFLKICSFGSGVTRKNNSFSFFLFCWVFFIKCFLFSFLLDFFVYFKETDTLRINKKLSYMCGFLVRVFIYVCFLYKFSLCNCIL